MKYYLNSPSESKQVKIPESVPAPVAVVGMVLAGYSLAPAPLTEILSEST